MSANARPEYAVASVNALRLHRDGFLLMAASILVALITAALCLLRTSRLGIGPYWCWAFATGAPILGAVIHEFVQRLIRIYIIPLLAPGHLLLGQILMIMTVSSSTFAIAFAGQNVQFIPGAIVTVIAFVQMFFLIRLYSAVAVMVEL